MVEVVEVVEVVGVVEVVEVGWLDLRMLLMDEKYPAKVPGAGMEDGCSVGIGGDKLLAIGGYWETKQV